MNCETSLALNDYPVFLHIPPSTVFQSTASKVLRLIIVFPTLLSVHATMSRAFPKLHHHSVEMQSKAQTDLKTFCEAMLKTCRALEND